MSMSVPVFALLSVSARGRARVVSAMDAALVLRRALGVLLPVVFVMGLGLGDAQALTGSMSTSQVVPLIQVGGQPDYSAMALKWARMAAQEAVPDVGVPLQLDVTVGALDARVRLAPCVTMEAYLPVGAHFWGRSRVGLRCVEGTVKWNVSMPMTVKATGLAWVVRSQIAAGSTVMESDVVQAEVDWAEENSPVLPDVSSWRGQVATRSLTTGQTLRQGMVKAAQVFQAGAMVRIVTEGVGFQASSEAQAISAGVVGQLARVRMDNGNIATGVVLDAHTVQIAL